MNLSDNTVFTGIFSAPPVNKSEIFRYAGDKGKSPETEKLIDECLSEAEDVLDFKVCYTLFDIKHTESGLDIGFCKTDSQVIFDTLFGCEKGILFAATVGANIDRLITGYSKISPLKAVIMQAIGAERIESLCDAFCADAELSVNKIGKFTTGRISAGYGDIPLDMQRDIFKFLDCSKKTGITLGENLIMSPSKSVTALMGISNIKRDKPKRHDCKQCNKTDCPFRRTK